ncbi:hypothetical protein NECAME_12712 [Necator americanus]|uniref:Uncharacterized protein n=1 Tax=Necator americanus TaxID=51031 RepID=W2T0U1_NECAM|nr:hypothetical protein NECAME_12712 [Necator americanus]ETN74846.1 hypothetical protein NECAME_12712 [Necator americanus]
MELKHANKFLGPPSIKKQRRWTSTQGSKLPQKACFAQKVSMDCSKSGYLLLGYHSKPTLFQVNTVVAEAGIYFPDITICNYNPSLGYNMSSKVFSYLLTSYNDHFDDDGNSEDHALFERYLTDSLATNFSIADFFEKIRPTCEDMVLSCSFAGEIIENCCSFSNVVPTDLGYCVRERNGDIVKAIGMQKSMEFLYQVTRTLQRIVNGTVWLVNGSQRVDVYR